MINAAAGSIGKELFETPQTIPPRILDELTVFVTSDQPYDSELFGEEKTLTQRPNSAQAANGGIDLNGDDLPIFTAGRLSTSLFIAPGPADGLNTIDGLLPVIIDITPWHPGIIRAR